MKNQKAIMLLANWLQGDLGRQGHKGRRTRLAEALGVSRQSIYNWEKWERIPAEHVLKIEEITGISRSELRPDIYPKS